MKTVETGFSAVVISLATPSDRKVWEESGEARSNTIVDYVPLSSLFWCWDPLV
jgi:hypothetical protein